MRLQTHIRGSLFAGFTGTASRPAASVTFATNPQDFTPRSRADASLGETLLGSGTTPTMTIELIAHEIDTARRAGALKNLVIPPCPDLLSQLQEVMAHEHPDLNAVQRIASSDVAMATVLLRSANSPYYGRGQSSSTVGQAMTILGLKQTAAVLTGFLTKTAIPANSPLLERFWERSAKRAVAMTHVARQLAGVPPDLAHTVGLFCHVGIPVMLQGFPGYKGTLVEARARKDRSFTETENANHRTDHAVVGALVVRSWRMSPTVMACIRLHHDIGALRDERISTEVRTLLAATLVAQHLMQRDEGLDDTAEWAQHGEACMAWLEVTPPQLSEWAEELAHSFDAGA